MAAYPAPFLRIEFTCLKQGNKDRRKSPYFVLLLEKRQQACLCC